MRRGRTGRAVFDTNGNVGTTIWSDGRIVGAWAVRSGEVVTRFLEDVGRDVTHAVEREAARWSDRSRSCRAFRRPCTAS
jgi:hypothetical protein